jgi:hypothetical protein
MENNSLKLHIQTLDDHGLEGGKLLQIAQFFLGER